MSLRRRSVLHAAHSFYGPEEGLPIDFPPALTLLKWYPVPANSEMTQSGNYHPCCRGLNALETCIHKDGYLRVEAYVRSKGVPVGYARDGAAAKLWKVAEGCMKPASIWIWQTAYEIYGWDMVTSALIHEFGHCKLYESEGIWEGSIEVERKANEYGRKHVPPDLVPALYEEHRNFFLKSYETPWTREQCLEAHQQWCTQFERTEPHY